MKKRWILALAVLAVFILGFLRLGDGQKQQGREQLEKALRRAAVACYAAEGIYPPTTEYLVEHYGIQIDHSRYAVFYEVFAENLMPEITVGELQP